jgi:hypothetical protein
MFAARVLARIGTGDTRTGLWRRLHEWHAGWSNRNDDLRRATLMPDDPGSEELGLARTLREALLRGRGWLTTADDRLRVRESCVTAACREEFSPFRGGPPLRLVVVEAEEWTGHTVHRVEGHAFSTLEAVGDRLMLYPKTVAIAWHAGASHAPARAAVLYKALAAAASSRGLAILAQPPTVTSRRAVGGGRELDSFQWPGPGDKHLREVAGSADRARSWSSRGTACAAGPAGPPGASGAPRTCD